MNRKVRKAVFPVAGLGTRFLPATKAIPKEMLPVVDKPLIQYAVEEAVAAGVGAVRITNLEGLAQGAGTMVAISSESSFHDRAGSATSSGTPER